MSASALFPWLCCISPSYKRRTISVMAQMALIVASIKATQGIEIGPSIVEVSSSFNSLFPFHNFNRNVSVPSWETSLLNGTNAGVLEDLDYLANTSFIAYEPDFYKVCRSYSKTSDCADSCQTAFGCDWSQ